MTRSVADSPPDAAFMRDPRNLADDSRGYITQASPCGIKRTFRRSP
ncbi:hypothetical protein [Phenylobacterium sp.]|nr:hypothetical protein [Phenylobacterium sp.]MDO8799637.1 hypothetical protein [Phenylobacterium sp.]